MVALKIVDIKQFMSCLLTGDTFDDFLTREVQITTFNRFSIDGHIRQGYYTEEEQEEKQIEELSSWKTLKPICFSLIKGKRLPGSFQVVLQLSPDATETFLKENQLPFATSQVNGVYLNIRYEEGSLTCVTGTSLNVFTMDQSCNQSWDQWVKNFFKKEEIACYTQ